jgi:hypothetical protein
MTIDLPLIVAVCGFLFEAVIIVAGAVWLVGKIRSDSAVLKNSMDALASSIEKLSKTVEHLDRRLDDHQERLAVIEAISDTARVKAQRRKDPFLVDENTSETDPNWTEE